MKTQESTEPKISTRLEADLRQSGKLCIRVLGSFDLIQNNLPLPRTRSRTEKWLLALLLLTNHEVERSWLAGTLWPDTSPEQAFNNLRRSLSNLRQVLGEESYRLLSPTPHTIVFDLSDAFCDVTAFDAAIARGDVASLRSAVALYQGALLPGCNADWLVQERHKREQVCIEALETLAALAIQSGKALEAVGLLRRAIHIDPYRETIHCALMEALVSQGDRAGMTMAYREFRLLLHEDLQSEPSAETKALYQRLREPGKHAKREESGGESSSTPHMLAKRPYILHIPLPMSELVGRKEESKEVAALLSSARLVTLTGTGGVGKTRLSLDVAVKVAPNFRDGVWFVDLAAVAEDASVVNAVVTALELPEEAGQSQSDTLRHFLADKELLLVLDNCEHLLNACATLVTTLLHNAPTLRVLATSRQALGLAGERAWRVPSLALPERADLAEATAPDTLLEWPATRLFMERALETSATFTMTARNARFVVDICRRLDGIPLTIELAAARVKVLSVEQIAVRLEDAFRLLTGGDRAALPRHQTLRGLLDWSYALLTGPEQRLLSILSVFVGGWTLEAAEAVAAEISIDSRENEISADVSIASDNSSDILDLLTSLVDKSLVTMHEAESGEVRYRLLETIQQYAHRRLQENGGQANVFSRHAAYFIHLAEEAEKHRTGPMQVDWLNRLEADHNNLRMVLTRHRDNEIGLRLASSLAHFWKLRGHLREGSKWLSRLLAANDNETATPLRAKALHGAGIMAYDMGDLEIARDFYQQCLTIHQGHGNSIGVAHMAMNLGNVAYRQGDNHAARLRYEEGLILFRSLDQVWGIASALGSLGNIEDAAGNYAAARDLQEESLALSRRLGDTRMTASTLHNLANLAVREGNAERALPLYEESLAIKRAMGDRRGIAALLTSLGSLVVEAGDHDRAEQYFLEAMSLAMGIEDKMGMINALDGLAWQAAARDEPLRAARLWGASESAYELMKITYSQQERDGLIAAARQKSDAKAFADAWTEGHALSLEQIAREIVTLDQPARI